MKSTLITAVLALIFIGHTVPVFSQTFMNEWIDHGKTYYRFKVGSKGVCRISKAQLTTVGIGDADAAHFQLWRRGEEVPVYTSVETGSLPADGFIEFWGEINDGFWEKRLYLRPEYQINPQYSLFSDTSVYFLTVNTQGNNKRLRSTNNDINSTLSPEPYFMHRARISFRNQYSQGFAAIVGSELFSSSYDNGEGYVSPLINPGNTFSQTLSNLFVYNNEPDAYFRYTAAGKRLNLRNISASLNNTIIDNREMNYYNSINDTAYIKISNSLIALGTGKIDFRNLSDATNDGMVIGMYELLYPRQFNFGGQTNFEFELPANSNGNKLLIKNFNYEGILPVLYDLTNGYRLTAEVDSSGDLIVVLPPSPTRRKLVMASIKEERINNISNLFTRNFINYNQTANQGNYIIISNPLLYADGSGVNQVEAYAQYRSSAEGGRYKTVIADINHLIDQFGWGIKNNPLSIKNFLRFARTNFPDKNQYCLLIGKGVSPNLVRNRISYNVEGRRDVELLNLVATFGVPSSDNILAADEGDVIPKTHIGRLNVVNGAEIKSYLEKIKIQESNLAIQSCNINDEIWKKDILHIGGANDSLGEQIKYYLDQYKKTAEDSLWGAKVYTLQKSASNSYNSSALDTIQQLFKNGFSLMTYFGNSSVTTLEFNLDKPENYPYSGRFPVFLVNGNSAGNLFTLDSLRLTGNYTLSEKYIVTTPLRGGIAFIASTHLGIVNYLNLYTEEFYNQVTKVSFGKSLGEIISNICDTLISRYTINNFFVRHHVEQITLHGDPAVKMYQAEKPDYAIDETTVKINPESISVVNNFYKIKIKIYNLGLVSTDSLPVKIERITPKNIRDVLYANKIKYIPNSDSIELMVNIDPNSDTGLYKIIITVDPDNLINEICENNNFLFKNFFIKAETTVNTNELLSVITENNWRFYPNPVNSDRIQIQFDNPINEKMIFQIIDLKGQVRREFFLGAGYKAAHISVNDLSDEIYFIKNISSKNSSVKKLLIIRK